MSLRGGAKGDSEVKKSMNYKNWEVWYNKILQDFGFSRYEDEKSAKILVSLLKNKTRHPISILKNLICRKNAYVFGSGNNLYEGIKKIKKRKNSVFISADGTTSALMAKGIMPDVVVTDLDGNVEDQIKANEMGAIVVIHAHGDNIPALKKYVLKFPGTVIGTTQSRPFDGIYNFGGFTDGDRGAFLAKHFYARRIYLVGFDFTAVGKLSCAKNKKIKLKKLKWAERLIQKIEGICFL